MNSRPVSCRPPAAASQLQQLAPGETDLQQKAKLMFRFEQEISQPIETPLPRLINSQGIADTAAQLGVSKATTNYWMLNPNIPVQQ